MNKINNKKINIIFYSLGILAILAFGIMLLPTKANAQYYTGNSGYYYGSSGYYGGTPFVDYSSSYQAPLAPIYYSTPTAPITVTPTIYSSSTNPNAKVATKPKTVAKVTTPAKTTDTASALAANAIFGSNSFMPSGLIQWIFFAILLLLVVILVRKISGADKKYQATPMKHA